MMFDEQIVLHQDQSENAFPHEKRALKDNYEILQKRLKMLHDKQEELAKNLRAVNEYNRELDLEMNSLKPEIIELYKQREQHQTWLLSHGARVEEINRSAAQSLLVILIYYLDRTKTKNRSLSPISHTTHPQTNDRGNVCIKTPFSFSASLLPCPSSTND